MKFNIKSALPTAAVVVVAVTSTANTDHASAQSDPLLHGDLVLQEKSLASNGFSTADWGVGIIDSCGASDSGDTTQTGDCYILHGNSFNPQGQNFKDKSNFVNATSTTVPPCGSGGFDYTHAGDCYILHDNNFNSQGQNFKDKSNFVNATSATVPPCGSGGFDYTHAGDCYILHDDITLNTAPAVHSNSQYTTQLQTNDSSGACNVASASDSCSAGDSFGTTPDTALGYGVWTIERDTTPADQLFTPSVQNTICFKANAEHLIGQVKSVNGAMPNLVIGTHYKYHGVVRLNLTSDQSISGDGKTGMLMKRPNSPNSNYWTGVWRKGSHYGELRARLFYSETPYGNAYDFNGCGSTIGR